MHASPFLTLSFHQSSRPATPTRILPLRLRTPSLRLETTSLSITQVFSRALLQHLQLLDTFQPFAFLPEHLHPFARQQYGDVLFRYGTSELEDRPEGRGALRNEELVRGRGNIEVWVG